jgi:peptide/nickel transport system ATP-binding protein
VVVENQHWECHLQLDKATSGQIYRGQDITKLGNKEIKKIKKDIQIIFSDPYASLNPKRIR